MANPNFSVQEVRRLFNYDPSTGVLTNRVERSTRTIINGLAGWINGIGYLMVRVNGRCYLGHRLVWVHAHGKWPDHHIDHINCIRDDNRIENLRDVTRSFNIQNQKRCHVNNKVGLLGVYALKNGYMSAIHIGNLKKYLGRFSTPQEAHEAYVKAKRELHPGCTI